jgi:hypothetical protein
MTPTNISRKVATARAGNRRFGPLSALRAHTKAPYKMDFHRKTLMALKRPGAARTVAPERERVEVERRERAPDNTTPRDL